MAKRRILKRSITEICSALFAEGVASSLENAHPEDAEAILSSLLKMETDFICRISHVEPGMKPKLYFKDLREDFTKEADEIIEHINNL